MKKINFQTPIYLIVLIALVLMLSGCDGSDPYAEQTPVAVAIVLGNHANAYTPNLGNTDLVSDVARATTNGFISVICCDGQPYIASADLYIIPEQYRQADPKKLESDAQSKANKLLSNLTQIKAQSPELDTLESLWQAVNSFSMAPADSEKIICMLDTGFSMVGALNFHNNLLTADPDVISDELAKRGAIPDFSGITVKWVQMGDVALPQPPLSYAQNRKLREIWTAIIEKGGGKMEISGAPPSREINDSSEYPEISVVELPQETALSFDPDEITVFDEQRVQFIGDSAQYVDPEAAAAALQPAAEYMISHPEFKGLLVGTTATGRKKFCRKLSESRAESVRDTLVSMGVLDGQLITRGLGFDDPWHVADTDFGGNLIEKLASQNRKVVLLSADSAEAKKLLDNS